MAFNLPELTQEEKEERERHRLFEKVQKALEHRYSNVHGMARGFFEKWIEEETGFATTYDTAKSLASKAWNAASAFYDVAEECRPRELEDE